MGKKTSSASSESVRMSSDPATSPSTESLDQSEMDISTDGQNGEKVKKKEKLGLIKRMSMRREKKKDKEKEKQLEKERTKEQKEKAKEEKEKAKEEKAKEEKEKAKEEKATLRSKSKDKGKDKDDTKNKNKQKDEPKDKEKDKTKDKDKDRRKEEGQKNTTDKIYRKISMDDFEEKQTEFKLWMLEQQNGSVDNMKASKVKSFFKKFVKEWNKKNLPHRYYWSSEETPPPSRAGSRFSFAEEVQTPDYLNFPSARVDLSNDDLDSEDGTISRSESFSTFGKTQKPEGLNDEVTPTMPKRPLLSAVFPMADTSVNSAKISPTVTKMLIKPVVICEDVDEPSTPTPETSALVFESTPTLLTYEHSPGLLNDTLKERYAITPDNNNVRNPLDTHEVQTSNYICMEDNILPGEELQVTQLLERAIMDEGPSGELTPIAEEEALNAGAKHSITSSSVVEALQPVVEKQIMEMKANNDTFENSWEVVNSEAENGHPITFTGLPPPPKQWKRDEMGLTNTILPPVRPISQERTITSTQVTSVPVAVYEQNENQEQNIAIQRTTITTVQHVTQPNQASVTEEITSPSIITSTVLMQDSPQSPSMTTMQERNDGISHTTSSPQSIVYSMEEVHSPTLKSPTVTLHMQQYPSPQSEVIQKQTVDLDRQQATTSSSSISVAGEDRKLPVFKKEMVNERSPERSTILAPSTVTIHQESVSIPASSHITLTKQQMPPSVQKQEASHTVCQPVEPTVFVYESNRRAAAPVTKEEIWEVSPKRDIVVTERVSHSISTSPPPPVPVQHTVVTRSTPVLHQTNETKNIYVYQEQPQFKTSSIVESAEDADVVYRKRNVRVSTSPVSPTANNNDEKSTARHSLELKHVEQSVSHERKGPYLSPMIVSASTVPMLFQEAMRPKEISIHPETPTAAHLRSPDKPKPAPRPKSLKSPTSPTSKIPVSVTEKPSPVVKPAVRNASPTTPERGSFKSSHTLVMTTSPSYSVKQPVTFATEKTERVSKIPPPKAPRPVSSPVTSPLSPASSTVSPDPYQVHVVQRDSYPRSLIPPPKAPHPVSSPVSSPLSPASSTVSPDPYQVHVVQRDSYTRSLIPPPKAPRPVSAPVSSPLSPATSTVSPDPQAHIVQRESHTRSLKPSSAVFANDSQSGPVQGNQNSYSKFMYEQPSFLGARTTGSRRSMSRISFTPPKPTPNTRMTASYIEPSPSKSCESFERSDEYKESGVPKSLSDFDFGDRLAVSYTEPSTREESVLTTNVKRTVQTEDNADDLLVRPAQTRTTFGPTFMRLSGDRRSLSALEKKQYSPVQSLAPKTEPKPFVRDVVFSEGAQVNPFRGQTKIRASSASDSSYDSSASNIVNRYLMEIKENTELISVPGTDISKSAENISNPSPREEKEKVQITQSSRIPIHETSAYTNEYRPIIQASTGEGRQSATLPRNFKGISMGAVVVEMGTSHPSQVKQSSSQERIDYRSTGERQINYREQTGGPDFHTPGSRSSYAGYSPGRQYTSPQYAYSEYHIQKPLNTPRDRSSFAGSPSQSTLSAEEMARLKEVLRR